MSRIATELVVKVLERRGHKKLEIRHLNGIVMDDTYNLFVKVQVPLHHKNAFTLSDANLNRLKYSDGVIFVNCPTSDMRQALHGAVNTGEGKVFGYNKDEILVTMTTATFKDGRSMKVVPIRADKVIGDIWALGEDEAILEIIKNRQANTIVASGPAAKGNPFPSVAPRAPGMFVGTGIQTHTAPIGTTAPAKSPRTLADLMNEIDKNSELMSYLKKESS